MEENQVLLTTKGYWVMDSMERTLTYGVTVYQVWSREKSSVWHSGKVNTVESADCLEYETSSKAKANAVCEYLTLKAAQEDADQYRIPEIRGTFIPHSIKS